MHERLTGSVDTAAGTCHHLDEIEMLAALYALNEFFGVSETAHNAYMQRCVTVGNIDFLHALKTAERLVHNSVAALVVGDTAEHCFGNASGCSEDNACACHSAERHVYSLRADTCELDSGFLHHLHELLGGQNIVYHMSAVSGAELLPESLALLGGAGHQRNMDVLLRFFPELLADNRREHLHGRFAA